MRVALVHDWLVGQRGGENVLLQLCRLFPAAPIYTLVHQPGSVAQEIEAHSIIGSDIARLPGAPRRFRAYLPLFHAAVARWDLAGFDAILSTSHCVVHGLRRGSGQVHLCYVHTPARYLYDALDAYLPTGRLGRLVAPLAQLAAAPLRHLDRRAARRPTQLLANSAFVAGRIARQWGRSAQVLHPPVDVDYFARPPRRRRRRHGYLCVSALVPYKRIDLAIALANHLRLPLTVVGRGGALAALRAQAGPTVRFVPSLSRPALRQAFWQAAGLLFCGCEDFGIVPVEAMAAGCPVLGLGQGGLCESVGTAGGELVPTPTLAAFVAGYRRLQARRAAGALTQTALQARAQRFAADRFVAGYVAALAQHGIVPGAQSLSTASLCG